MGDVEATRYMANERELDFVDLDTYGVDPAAAAILPAELSRHHHVVAVKRKFGTPVIATADPDDLFALDSIRAILGRDFISVVASSDQIDHYLDVMFSGGSGLSTGPVPSDAQHRSDRRCRRSRPGAGRHRPGRVPRRRHRRTAGSPRCPRRPPHRPRRPHLRHRLRRLHRLDRPHRCLPSLRWTSHPSASRSFPGRSTGSDRRSSRIHSRPQATSSPRWPARSRGIRRTSSRSSDRR